MTETPSSDNAGSGVIRLLVAEKEKLLREVERIDRILASEGVDPRKIGAGVDPRMTAAGRPRNQISKLGALMNVLASARKPLTQRELVLGIQELGYVFSSRRPVNTLNPYLYGKKRLPTILKTPKGFILATRSKEFGIAES